MNFHGLLLISKYKLITMLPIYVTWYDPIEYLDVYTFTVANNLES